MWPRAVRDGGIGAPSVHLPETFDGAEAPSVSFGEAGTDARCVSVLPTLQRAEPLKSFCLRVYGAMYTFGAACRLRTRAGCTRSLPQRLTGCAPECLAGMRLSNPGARGTRVGLRVHRLFDHPRVDAKTTSADDALADAQPFLDDGNPARLARVDFLAGVA